MIGALHVSTLGRDRIIVGLMFPLTGDDFPTSSVELAAAMRAVLLEYFTLPKSGEAVRVAGDFPAPQSVQIDVDGASLRGHMPPGPVGSISSRQPAFTSDALIVSACPVLYQQARLNLRMSAKGLIFEFGRDDRGRPILIVAGIHSGEVEADITDDDIDALSLAVAQQWSKSHGIAVQDVHAVLVSDAPRSVSVEIRVKAKKMMMSGAILVRGRIDIGHDLAATVSGISCIGEGMIGSAAAAMVQKKIQPFEGKRIALTQSLIGELELRDVRVGTADDGVRITASFG